MDQIYDNRYSSCQTMKTTTIIWDFDGTLLPLAPYDSEQTLMRFKLDDIDSRPPWIIRAVARLLILADRRQMLRKTFKRFYIQLMKGTPATVMDQVGERLSDSISTEDRQTIAGLKSLDYRMFVLSCGTADLSERTLQCAGLAGYFETIAGNRFKINDGVIDGMTLHIPNPVDKVKWAKMMGLSSASTIAIGDGYTDIPLLDWAKISVLVDRSGEKRTKYKHKDYRFISSTSEILEVLL
jgi:phosphoserine phosphatase